ncbi:hypothetical protein P170DRAFT_344994 [Aspergillus steynii IBT 23096]|uniref:Uncharacterized protein n=1 Tax=Aspergillus steynii IBT 23096 TaxID=1392250 RepID=A0A2I2GS35_9EURO|nr:uncharacterized protein P170DRAFT_344994 [Aspergillus steynii IBT 23096]PLB55680.1 hypothetical protein P170DRAFT_344994 [Aspergillus steynii IBT 23096]
MGNGIKRKHYRRYVKIPWCEPREFGNCIVCGASILCPPWPHEDQEEYTTPAGWEERLEQSKGYSFSIKAKELEEMEFPPHSITPMTFCRAILDKPGHPLQISGITQHQFCLSHVDEDPVPCDASKARVGSTVKSGNQHYAEYFAANVFKPDIYRAKGKRVGYNMHMPCWVLLCRLIGKRLMEENLDCFVEAIKSFWRSKSSEWDIDFDVQDYDDSCYGIMPWSERPRGWPEYDYGEGPDRPEHWQQVKVNENPGIIFDIQQVIKNAYSAFGRRFATCGDHLAHQIPVELAIMIVDLIRKAPGYGLEDIKSTRNMLSAFGWSLPDTYWQSRCRNRLIFEVEDLIEAGSKVDWQLVCLGLEELLFDHHWYFKGGLRNRGRILQLIGQIKVVFLERLNSGVGSGVNIN